MTLTRLVLAWIPVAVEFTIVRALGIGEPRDPSAPGDPFAAMARRYLPLCSAEAAVATLVASLWFDSLGHGGWWLLFLLLGLLVAVACVAAAPAARALRGAMPLLTRDALRYVLAGAILAWRLG